MDAMRGPQLMPTAGPEFERFAVAEEGRDAWTENDAGCRAGIRALRGRK